MSLFSVYSQLLKSLALQLFTAAPAVADTNCEVLILLINSASHLHCTQKLPEIPKSKLLIMEELAFSKIIWGSPSWALLLLHWTLSEVRSSKLKGNQHHTQTLPEDKKGAPQPRKREKRQQLLPSHFGREGKSGCIAKQRKERRELCCSPAVYWLKSFIF